MTVVGHCLLELARRSVGARNEAAAFTCLLEWPLRRLVIKRISWPAGQSLLLEAFRDVGNQVAQGFLLIPLWRARRLVCVI